MFDMFSMMGKIKEAQEKIKAAQDQMVHVQHTAESGAGLVKVTVNGHRKLLKIDIDSSIMNDKEMVQDLCVAAANKALDEIEPLIREEIKKSVEGLIPNIPGLDIESFFRS